MTYIAMYYALAQHHIQPVRLHIRPLCDLVVLVAPSIKTQVRWTFPCLLSCSCLA